MLSKAVCGLLLVALAIAAAQQLEGLSLPPPPAFEEEQPSFVESETEAVPLPNFAEADTTVRMDARYDFSTIPTDKQVDGNVAELVNAPGFVQAMSEEALPGSLLPPSTSKDANAINDVALWKTLTGKIAKGKATSAKYGKWLKQATGAQKKVKGQLKLTNRNHKLIQKAIKGMTHERRQIVNKIKAAKLDRDLKAAKEKLKKLDTYGVRISTEFTKLRSGEKAMGTRVKLIKNSMHDLRTLNHDA